MAFEQDWEEIKNDPEYATLSRAQQQKLVRKFASRLASKEVKGTDPRMASFLQANLGGSVGRPKTGAGAMVESVIGIRPGDFTASLRDSGQAIAANPIGTAKSLVKGLVDDSLGGQARRLTDRAIAKVITDPIARATGTLTQAQAQARLGRPANGRMFNPDVNPGVENEIGNMAGQMLDPVGLALPLNVITKPFQAAAPIARGINLLPKAAAPAIPSATRAAATGLAGAALTTGGIAGAQSMAADFNDRRPIDFGRARDQALLGAAFAGPLGAVAHGMAARGAARAVSQADASARARAAATGDQVAASARNPNVSDEQMRAFTNGRNLVDAQMRQQFGEYPAGALAPSERAPGLVGAAGPVARQMTPTPPRSSVPTPGAAAQDLVNAQMRALYGEAPGDAWATPRPVQPVSRPAPAARPQQAPAPVESAPLEFGPSAETRAMMEALDAKMAAMRAESERPMGSRPAAPVETPPAPVSPMGDTSPIESPPQAAPMADPAALRAADDARERVRLRAADMDAQSEALAARMATMRAEPARPPALPQTPRQAPLERTVPQVKEPPTRNARMNLADANVDARVYQFKDSADPYGVTERLRGVKRWDKEAAEAHPTIIHEKLDGTRYVADGHQRSGLARRLRDEGQAIPDSPILLLREADGWTTEMAVARAARHNVQQGTGSAIDVAKLLRNKAFTPDDAASIPPNSANWRDGQALAALHDEAFALVSNGKVAPQHAAHVGRILKAPEEQLAAMKVLQKSKPESTEKAYHIVRMVEAMGFQAKAQSEQGSFFAQLAEAEPLIEHGAAILTQAGRQLESTKNVFGQLLRKEGAVIEVKGNRINTEGSAAALADARAADALLSKFGHEPGPVRDVVKEQAALLAKQGTTADEAARLVLAAVETQFKTERKAGKSLRDLLLQESGEAAPFWEARTAAEVGRQAWAGAKATGRAALDAANAAAPYLRAMQEFIEAPARWMVGATRVDRIFALLEHWRQAIKTGATDSQFVMAFRRQFISDYGVPPEVLEMARNAERQAHREAKGIRRTAVELNRELDGHGQAALDWELSERPPTPGTRSTRATEIAAETTRLSQLLERIGALTPEARARWDGYYLPRIYEDKFPVISGMIKTASKHIKGSKGRGKEVEVSSARFEEMKDAEGWEHRGYTGPNAAKIQHSEDLLERLQADRATADKAGNARRVDVLDARIEKVMERQMDLLASPGTKVRAWRDYTPEERVGMGEVRHASARMAKMADKFERDFANGSLLAEIAKNPDFAMPIPKTKKGQPAPTPPAGWVEFKDINATSSGTGVKKWGALAGHWVREDVSHYLKTSIELKANMDYIKTITGVNVWKRFVTLYNPVYYLNNAMINVPTLEMKGGSTFDLPGVMLDFANDAPLIQQLDDLGTIRSGAVAKDLATSLQRDMVGHGGMLEIPMIIASKFKQFESLGGSLSQATDDLFRVALVKGKMREGLTLEEAARVAEDAFYNSSNVTAPMAMRWEALGVPFAKVLFYQLDKLPQMFLENPVKAGALLTYSATMYTLMNALNGTTAEEDEGRRKLLPKHMQGTNNMLPTPLKDAYGHPINLDTKAWNPLGGQSLGFSGIPKVLYNLSTNHDDLRDQPIYDEDEEAGVMLGQMGRYAADNMLPSALFHKGAKVVDAMHGRVDASGRRYDVPTAVANLAGVKLSPFDAELSYDRLEARYTAKLRKISSLIAKVERDMENNPGDAASLEPEMARLEARYDSLETEMEDTLAKAENALPKSPAK